MQGSSKWKITMQCPLHFMDASVYSAHYFTVNITKNCGKVYDFANLDNYTNGYVDLYDDPSNHSDFTCTVDLMATAKDLAISVRLVVSPLSYLCSFLPLPLKLTTFLFPFLQPPNSTLSPIPLPFPSTSKSIPQFCSELWAQRLPCKTVRESSNLI